MFFSAQPAFGHDAPEIVPTRLDFDASRAPKSCNDTEVFRSILDAWVLPSVLHDDAERRLVVRIHRSSTGGKRAELSIIDAQGAVVDERHNDYAANSECHYVLWKVALAAAAMLGAFEPPPPKVAIPCPASTPCPSCPPARPCQTHLPLTLPTPRLTRTPMPYRSFLGFGAMVSSGISSELGFGPYMMLGFVPSRRLSQLHIEFEGSWTSQASPSSTTLESIRLHSIPLVGSFCWVRGIVRFCGGLASTLFFSNQSSNQDELRMMFGGNFRVGTELFVHGPFSIRADVFARIAFVERRFGKATMALDGATPFAAGLAVTGAWSFD